MTSDNVSDDPVGRLAEEFVERYRRGERPALSEYTERHPELAGRIREVFPMLVMLEQAGPGEGASLEATCDGAAAGTDVAGKHPERIGGYRILREVGRGGMGVVYEAEQVALGRHVALKVLPLSAAGAGSGLERFRQEARAAARLHHSNIVPVYEVGEDAGACFYAMQFIPGQPLDQVLEELQALREASGGRQPPVGSCPRGADAPRSPGVRSLLSADEPATPSSEVVSAGRASSSSVSLPGQTDPSAVHSARRHYYRSVARVGVQVARALEYAHKEGVVHRDVKPSNLLLDPDGRVWVADFGLAKTADAALTQTGDVVGTVRYMAPERFRGWSDPRSDVYSLGLTLYEMVALRPAFEERDRLKLIRRISHEEPPRLRKLDLSVPRDLETIITKAADKEPGRRYQTVGELADDLERFLEDRPIRARRASRAEHVWRWCRRNPIEAGLLAAVVLVALAGLLAVLAQWRAALANERLAHENAARAEASADDARKKEEEVRRQRNEARRQRDEVRELNHKLADLNEELRRQVYVADMNLAGHAWEAAGVARMRELLDRHRPKPGQPDRRGFEWHYLDRLSRAYRLSISGHVGFVKDVAFSPDGTRLASASNDRTVRVWDAETGKEVGRLRHEGPVQALTFSPDGKLLASASTDGTARLWDWRTGKVRHTLRGHKEAVNGVAFAPDGRLLVTGGEDGTIRVWDVQSGKEARPPLRQGRPVNDVAFSPDGQYVAATYRNRSVWVWDLKTGERRVLEKHPGAVLSLAFSPDGKLLAGASADQTIRVWDFKEGKLVRTLRGHNGRVRAVAFSPDDSTRLASAGSDRTVRVWDVRTGEELYSFKGHTDGIFGLAFSPDGKRLATASTDRTVKVWDANKEPEGDFLRGACNNANGVTFSPKGGLLASCGKERIRGGLIEVWNLRGGKGPRALRGHAWPVQDVAFSPDGKLLASASHDQTVKLWDPRTGEEQRTLAGHKGPVNSVAFSPDGKLLATASADQTVRLWDVRTGKELQVLRGHAGRVWSVAFSPDGKLLASASDDWMVRVWDVRTSKELLVLRGHQDRVRAVAFSPDGKLLATASADQTARLWDVRIGKELHVLRGHAGRAWDVAFSPDGRRLATASLDSTVKIWDTREGKETLTLPGGDSPLHGVAFSPDGHRLAAATLNGAVRLWDATPSPQKP